MNAKTLVLSAVLVFGYLVSTAQRCKFEVDDKDPITDDIIRTIKNRITGPISGITQYYYFYYKRSGSNFKIRVEVADYGELKHSIPEKSELIMRTGGGDIIRIYSIAEVFPKTIKDITQVLTVYEVEYEIPEEEMKKIADSGVVFIRGVDFKNAFSDQKIPRAVVEQSQINAACLFRE